MMVCRCEVMPLTFCKEICTARHVIFDGQRDAVEYKGAVTAFCLRDRQGEIQ